MLQGRGPAYAALLSVAACLFAPVTLRAGDSWVVRGKAVRADNGVPVEGVGVSAFDLTTDEDVPVAGDVTDSDGKYRLVLPAGIYDVTFAPTVLSVGSPDQLAPFRVSEVSVDSRGVRLGNVALPRGHRVSGTVLGPSSTPLTGARLTFAPTAGGEPLFVPNAVTALGGVFDVTVGSGTYDIRIDPPSGQPLASTGLAAVSVGAATMLGSQTLLAGFTVSGSVVDPEEVPLQGVAIRPTADDVPVAAPNPLTDASGQYAFLLGEGSYQLGLDPELNSHVDPGTMTAVVAREGGQPAMVLQFHNDDGDFTPDALDDCPFRTDSFQKDFDGDGVGTLCDICPLQFNPRQQNNDGTGGGDACDPDDDDDHLADFADPDLDGDSINNFVDNCPNAWNLDQRDTDGNDVGDACDAEDGQVEFLQFLGRTRISWRPEDQVSGYRVYRQLLSRLSGVNYGTCWHAAPGNRPFARETDVPEPGEGFAYVVTGQTASGEAPLGFAGDGTPRPSLRPCN